MSTILSIIPFVVLVIAIALASYGVARFSLKRFCDAETRDLAGTVMFRIAGVHGLVLALVFAQDMLSVRDVSTAAAEEATLLGDIYYDALRYDEESTYALREHLARYGLLVVSVEWQSLADEDRLSPEAWSAWDAAYEELLVMEPMSLRQDRLHNDMLRKVRGISALRDTRENAAIGSDSSLFLWAALAGVVLISAVFFTWPATLLNIGLIASFSGYIGLILYMVISFSNAFAAPGRASFAGFERFLTPEVRQVAEQADMHGVPTP